MPILHLKKRSASVRSVNSRLSIAIHCLIFIFEYGDETRVTSTILSATTGCNPVIVRNLLSALKKAGIVSIPKGTGGAKLCLAPGEITLYTIYSAISVSGAPSIFGFHSSPSALCPVGRSIHAVLKGEYQKLEDAVLQRMKTISLQDVLDSYHQKLTEP